MKKYDNLFSFDYIEYYKSTDWKNKICSDEVIGSVTVLSNNVTFKRREDYKNIFVNINDHDDYYKKEKVEIKGKISIILESPHINEFIIADVIDFSSRENINSRPANGKTGEYIDEYLTDIFGNDFKVLENGTYSLSLINSIQNQCSLGTDTRFYRDRIWTICWFELNKYSNNFISRIKSFNPNIILNCATVGEHFRILQNNTGYDTQKTALSYTKKFLSKEFETIDYSKNKANIQKIISEAIIEDNILKRKKIIHSTHPSSWYSGKNRLIKSFEDVELDILPEVK